jgi:hypothetical protein
MKLLANHAVDVGVQFVNANGNPAEVDGAVDWMSSNPAVASVEPNPTDDKLATITAGPSAGEAVITAVADSDLGEGMTEVEATVSITVIARGVAIGGEITPVTGPGGPSAGNELPGGGGGTIDNSLPNGQRPVDPGFGAGHPAPDRPDQGLPGSQPGIDNSLPGGQDTSTGPDNTLPEHAAPKS